MDVPSGWVIWMAKNNHIPANVWRLRAFSRMSSIQDYFWIKYLNASNSYVADVYHVLFLMFRRQSDESCV